VSPGRPEQDGPAQTAIRWDGLADLDRMIRDLTSARVAVLAGQAGSEGAAASPPTASTTDAAPGEADDIGPPSIREAGPTVEPGGSATRA